MTKTLLCSTIEHWATSPRRSNVSRTTGFCLIKIVCRSASHWEMKYLKSKGLNPANLWSCNNEGFPLHFDLFVIKYQMTAFVCQSKDWMSAFILSGWSLVNWAKYKIQSRYSAGKVAWNNLMICLLTLKVNCHHILFQGYRIKII